EHEKLRSGVQRRKLLRIDVIEMSHARRVQARHDPLRLPPDLSDHDQLAVVLQPSERLEQHLEVLARLDRADEENVSPAPVLRGSLAVFAARDDTRVN